MVGSFARALRGARKVDDFLARVRAAGTYTLEQDDLEVAGVLFLQGRLVILSDRTGEPSDLARPAQGSLCRLPAN